MTLTASSPALLERLGAEIDVRAPDYSLWQDYYDGRHQPPVALLAASSGYRSEYARWLSGFSDNFCRLVVQAVDERLTVTGFRVDGKAGDRKAWGYWQDNQLDAWHLRAHREALVKSWCPVTVDAAPDGSPRIRAHEADQFAIAWDDDDALERAAAMRRWATPDGRRLATLYFADRVEKYEQGPGSQWQRRSVAGEPWPLPHALGVVPVVPLVNDPDLYNRGQSEIGAMLPMQNALNLLMSDMLVSAEYTAYPQRWVTGLEIPVDPDTGRPIQPFKLAYDRMLMARDPNVRFGQLDAADLRPYIRAVEACIQHIASTTRTPPHYLLGQSGAFPSGESLKATETGLVAKVRRRQGDFGESWEECIGLAFAAAGDTKRAGIEDKEAVWKDPEVRTEAEHVDALLKLKALGVPLEQLWEDAGYSPQLIQKWTAAGLASPGAVDPSEPADPEAMAQLRAVAGAQQGPAASAAPERGGACPCCSLTPAGPAAPDGAHAGDGMACCALDDISRGDCGPHCIGGACCDCQPTSLSTGR